MKIFPLLLGLFLVLTTFVLPGTSLAQKQEFRDDVLRLEAVSNKSNYITGEPIVASFKITNLSNQAIEDFWFSYDNGFFVTLDDGAGQKASLAGIHAARVRLLTLWKQSLTPQESVTTTLDIVVGDVVEVSNFFLRGERVDMSREPVQASFLLQPGKYVVVPIQRYPTRPWQHGLDRWISYTAKAPFEVREPTEREQAALDLFKLRPLTGNYPPDPERVPRSQAAALAAYRELVAKYGDTPYAPYAQYYIGRILQVQGKWAAAAAAYQTTLQKHPDFPLKADLLYFLAFSLARADDKPQARQVLQRLETEFLHHLIAPNIRYLEKLSRVEALQQELAR